MIRILLLTFSVLLSYLTIAQLIIMLGNSSQIGNSTNLKIRKKIARKETLLFGFLKENNADSKVVKFTNGGWLILITYLKMDSMSILRK